MGKVRGTGGPQTIATASVDPEMSDGPIIKKKKKKKNGNPNFNVEHFPYW